jgi:hypothetical protein
VSDPFRFEPDRHRDPEPVQEGPGRVLVPCLHCDTMLARQQYPPYSWVHADDEVVLVAGHVATTTKYTHEPEPDVIDVEIIL